MRALVPITKAIRSILIIQTKFLGDLILVAALVQNLRLHFPGAKIVILCAEGFEDFVVTHRIADATVTFPRARMRGPPFRRVGAFFEVIRKLRSYRFDLTIDLTDFKTTRVIVGLVNAPIRVGYSPSEKPLRNWERQPNNFFSRPYGHGGKHFLDRYLAPLETLGLDLLTRTPVIDPLPHEAEKAAVLLAEHGLRSGAFVMVHVGASFIGRSWQPDRFAAAIDRIAEKSGVRFVLVGGADEAPLADAILAGASSQVVNCVGKVPLAMLVALLKHARLFLGNESGPLHLAAAVGTPVVGLYGLTDPVRWGPVGVPHVTLRPPMPCKCLDTALCQWPDPSKSCCVWHLRVDEVVNAACELLTRSGPAGHTGYAPDSITAKIISQQSAAENNR